MDIKTINAELGKSRQGVTYTEYLEIRMETAKKVIAAKLRIRIYSDSYDFQSYAIAELYSPDRGEWSQIASRHYSQMGTPTKLAYLPNGKGDKPEWFRVDREYLVALAIKILTP